MEGNDSRVVEKGWKQAIEFEGRAVRLTAWFKDEDLGLGGGSDGGCLFAHDSGGR